MSAPPRTDPVSAPEAHTGSRRPRVLATLVVGLVVASLVRGLVLQTYVVPNAASLPTLAPGDRVLVLTTDRSAEAGEVVLVRSGDGTARLVPGSDARGDVLGTALWRWWPLDRLGPVTASGAEA